MTMADDKRDGLVHRMKSSSPRTRTATVIGASGAGVTGALYASEPLAHAANALVHGLGVVTAESVGVGAGAALASVGLVKAGEQMERGATRNAIALAGVATAGAALTAMSIGGLTHDLVDAAPAAVFGGIMVGGFGTVFSGLIQEDMSVDTRAALRRLAVGSASLGVGGVLADALNAAGLHGVPAAGVMGHIGVAALAAAAVPAAANASARYREAKKQRLATRARAGLTE